MKWQDDKQETALLKDTSIVNFKDDGSVELYPSTEWNKPRNKNKHGFGHCHNFQFKSKEQAIKVFIELENNLQMLAANALNKATGIIKATA